MNKILTYANHIEAAKVAYNVLHGEQVDVEPGEVGKYFCSRYFDCICRLKSFNRSDYLSLPDKQMALQTAYEQTLIVFRNRYIPAKKKSAVSRKG